LNWPECTLNITRVNINVSLPDSDADFVQEKVASGRFGSSSDVVRAALGLLREAERERSEALERLRCDFQAGIDSGEAAEIDFDVLKMEVRAGLAERTQGPR